MGNAFALTCAVFCSIATVILCSLACAGSTKNVFPLREIFVVQISLSHATLSKILPSVSEDLLSSSILPTYFNVGLWSYCIADTEKVVQSCTSPSGIQKFNLQSMLYDNIKDNKVLETIDEISKVILPEKLETKINYYNDLVRCMFTTILIGIVLSFVSFVFSVMRSLIHVKLFKWLGTFFSFFAFCCLLISVGTTLGTYLYINRILNANYDEYGIMLRFGRKYMGIMWGGILASLLDLVSWWSVRSSIPVQQVAYVEVEPDFEKRRIL